MEVYDIGETAYLIAVFQNEALTDDDPETVTCVVRLPDDSTITYIYGTDEQIVKDSTGHYHVNFPVTMAGAHWYRIAGSAPIDAVEEKCFKVRTRKVA